MFEGHFPGDLKGDVLGIDGVIFTEVYLDGATAPIASTITGATELLRRRLGMSLEEFFNTYFTGQKELSVMAAMGPTDRAQFLSRVLGYERLREAQRLVRERRRSIADESAGLQRGMPDPEAVRRQLVDAEARLSAAERNARDAVARDGDAMTAPLGRVAAFAVEPATETRVQTAPAEPDDASLMVRYREGDMRAFEILYARHKGGLYRYLQRLCRNPDVANDLFQEVWGKVIAARERYEPRAQFNTFLFRIAHNCAVDYFRRAGRQQIGRMEDVGELAESLPDTPVSQPDTQVSEMQVRASFRQALEQLPTEQREAFLLYEETGLSVEEIGRTTGVAMETAKSRLRYAFRKLRTALRHHQSHTIGEDSEP